MAGSNGNEDASSVPKIIINIGGSKPNLRVNGLDGIHPMYEALIALFRKNLSEQSVVTRFAKDENTLRASIAADTLLDRLSEVYQRNVRAEFEKGSPLDVIVDTVAIAIAENKRTKDGKLLYSASEEAGKNPYFLKALRKADPRDVYVAYDAIPEIRERAKWMKRRGIAYKAISITAGILLTGLVLYGCYETRKYNQQMQKIEEKAKIDSGKK